MAKTLTGVVLGLALAAIASRGLAADSGEGARLANACTSCHGIEGRSVGVTPSLAGRPVDELVAMLKAFKDQSVESTIMGRLARGYSDDEITALATYFSSIGPQ